MGTLESPIRQKLLVACTLSCRAVRRAYRWAAVGGLTILVVGLSAHTNRAQSPPPGNPAANAGNDALVVTPEGNVGIGTSNPKTTLEVNGKVGVGTNGETPSDLLQLGSYKSAMDAYLTVPTGGGNRYRSGIKLRHNSDQHGFTIEADDRPSATGLKIIRHEGHKDGETALFVDRKSGYVGIGTTGSPKTALEVNGEIMATSANVTGGSLQLGSSTKENGAWLTVQTKSGLSGIKLLNADRNLRGGLNGFVIESDANRWGMEQDVDDPYKRSENRNLGGLNIRSLGDHTFNPPVNEFSALFIRQTTGDVGIGTRDPRRGKRGKRRIGHCI